MVTFHIPGATEDGDHSVRAYEDPGLQDLLLERKMDVQVPDSENARFLAMINDILRLRLAAPTVIDNRKMASALAALLPKELVA